MKTNKYEVKTYMRCITEDKQGYEVVRWYLVHKETKYFTNKQKALNYFCLVNKHINFKAVIRQKKGGNKTWQKITAFTK